MGHERIGVLPKSQQWRDVVQLIASQQMSEIDVSDIVKKTIQNVRSRFRHICRDEGVVAAFKFLIALSVASRSPHPRENLSALGIDVPENPSLLSLAKSVHLWVSLKRESLKADRSALSSMEYSQVLEAMKRMREVCDNPFHELPQGSFLEMIYERPYLKEPILGLVYAICNRLSDAIPIAFQKNPSKDENDFNDKVSAILESDKDEFEREHPAFSFALARAVPDHSLLEYGLLIESKYIRGSTSPSKASEGIAADLTKYPDDNYKLFIVYDPHRSITNDRKFRIDFEKKGCCTVCIIR